MMDAATFFLPRQLKGSTRAPSDGRQLEASFAGLKGVSRDLNIDQRGRCMSPSLTVPLPAILRRVSGSRKIIDNMIVAAKTKSTQKIDRKPRKWVRSPPITGLTKWLAINTARGKHP